jgi:hypothetical protein
MELRPTDLSTKAAISISYASEILSGERDPSRALAIHILRKTGWRSKVLNGLSEAEIAVFEKHEPWTPSKAKAA